MDICKKIAAVAFSICLFALNANVTQAAKKIIYIPLDNRPITCDESAEVIRKAGYEAIIPPNELLGGGSTKSGDPTGLWKWLNENAYSAEAAVVSTDAMLYGSLVDSRKHELTAEEVSKRVENFQNFHAAFPRLPVYGFGTIMRTLISPHHSDKGMEPEYYQRYAMSIYRYTALQDKIDMGIAGKKERREFAKLQKEIPSDVMEAWEARHIINENANRALTDLTANNVFNFLLLGCDDGAMYSRTHYESRHLRDYGKNVGKTRFEVLSGADELGMIMLCRAINDNKREIPFIYTAYNIGKGRNTIPTYCNDTVGNDIDGAITAAGGLQIPTPERADFVMAVFTNPNGKTSEANWPINTIKMRRGIEPFVKRVKDFADKGYNVGVADISFGNGADNALMEAMRKENLLFSVRAYGGWNTATNTTGFLIGTGLLLKDMTRQASDELMLIRYLDEWGYQANVRQEVLAALDSLPGEHDPQSGALNSKRPAAAAFGTEKLKEFTKKNLTLPPWLSTENLSLDYPWNRLFECEIKF